MKRKNIQDLLNESAFDITKQSNTKGIFCRDIKKADRFRKWKVSLKAI